MTLDTQSIVAITGCVLGVVTAVSTVANNYFTYKIKLRADGNANAIAELHDCVEIKHADLKETITAAALTSDALTVSEGNRHAG